MRVRQHDEGKMMGFAAQQKESNSKSSLKLASSFTFSRMHGAKPCEILIGAWRRGRGGELQHAECFCCVIIINISWGNTDVGPLMHLPFCLN